MPAGHDLHTVSLEPRRLPAQALSAADRVKVALHRLPWPLARRLAATAGYGYWLLRPARRAEARSAMRGLLEGTPRRADADELAPRFLVNRAVANELPWHLGVVRATPVAGLEHLRAARASGRGTLVSIVHLGPSAAMKLALAEHIPGAVVVTGGWLRTERAEGYRAEVIEQSRALARATGLRAVVPAGGTFEGLSEYLRAGGTVLLHADVPGRMTARFAGRELRLASGTPQLATACGALVVPVAFVRRGAGFAAEVMPALDPADHDGPEALLQALVDVHGAAVVRQPEALVEPHGVATWAGARATHLHGGAASDPSARPAASPW